MKSLSSFLVMFLLAVLVSCSSGGSNDLDRNGLKGTVKSTREFQCNATYESEKWVAGIECANGFRVTEYDADGLYIQAFSMSDCGDTTSLTTARRENGEVVEESNYTWINMTPKHTKRMLASRTMMARVSDDQVNFEVWQNEQLRYEGASYYDSKGRMERQVQVVNNREVILHHVYEKNLLVEMWQEELDGSRSATQLYEYSEFDEHGNWTLRLVYPGDEKITPEFAITRLLEYY
ncbi:MAG: hypothetical protein DRJ29_13595 [Bacteroidetes bacterium]|nr:MAG: hypothetical protein DRJ29_13595 [Bacteroidota bacterium]